MGSGDFVQGGASSPPDRCSFCGAKKTQERRLIASHDATAVVCEDCVARFVDFFGRWEEREPRVAAHSSELSRRYREQSKRPQLDPRDQRPPIPVQLNSELLGDLGHARVDARLLLAVALRNGRVATWLRERGIDESSLRQAFGAMDLGFDQPDST
jgi:hypothetical protein